MCHLRSVSSIDESGGLKSPTIILVLPILPFKFVNVCFLYLDVPILDKYLEVLILLLD